MTIGPGNYYWGKKCLSRELWATIFSRKNKRHDGRGATANVK